MNRKTTTLIFFYIALATILTSYVVASYLLSKPLSNTGIIGSADLAILREDNEAEITEICWGNFALPSVTTKISTDADVLGTRIILKNVGVVPLLVAWNASGLPTYLSITATWAGNPWAQSDFSAFRIDPGYVNGYITFDLSITDLSTTATAFAFTIYISARQAP